MSVNGLFFTALLPMQLFRCQRLLATELNISNWRLMMLKSNINRLKLLLMIMPLLVSSCASESRILPPVVVPPPVIPPLPQEARQPERPEICLPTCLEGLMKLRTELLNMLTDPQ